jgi:hypothetical protein
LFGKVNEVKLPAHLAKACLATFCQLQCTFHFFGMQPHFVYNNGRVGLALLRLCEDSILDLPFEQMLAIFKSKQCPAFAHSPDVVMKLAYSFRVSKRLAQFKAMYDGSSLPAEAEAAAEEERKNMKQHHRSVQQISSATDADSD